VDPIHSSIEFEVPFMGIARVTGRFNQFYGRIEYSEEDLAASSAEIVIRAASIDTEVENRDRDLRSENYFDVGAFPAIEFRSRKVRGESPPVLVGDLTIRDQTHPVEIPFEILGSLEGPDGREMGVEGSTSLDRRRFGISKGQFSGDQVFIGNEVGIRLLLRLREPSAEKRTLMEQYPPVDLSLETARELVGRYRAEEDGFELGVELLGTDLVLDRGGKLLRMVAIGPNEFRLDDFLARVVFRRDDGRPALVLDRTEREAEVYRAVD
jgi:polyisoprenoid-binding protein YceI